MLSIKFLTQKQDLAIFKVKTLKNHQNDFKFVKNVIKVWRALTCLKIFQNFLNNRFIKIE